MLADLYQDHDSEAFFGHVQSETSGSESGRYRDSHLILDEIKERYRRSQLKLVTSVHDIVVDCDPNHIALDLDPESDSGYIEFKYMLVRVQPDRIDHLCTQMKFRLSEGSGHAIYEIGVRDNGVAAGLSDPDLVASIRTVYDLCVMLHCHCYIVDVRRARHGKTAQLLIRTINAESVVDDVRICALGLTGSGKSSLIGVLVSGQLDNGNGSSRTNVFRHHHEYGQLPFPLRLSGLVNGRTSSLTPLLIGFAPDGSIANHSFTSRSVRSLIAISHHLITFIDLAGINSRHARTTLAGLAGQMPDYVCVAISSVCPAHQLESHLTSVDLSVLLRIPVFIVVTKIDLVASQHDLKHVTDAICGQLPIRGDLVQSADCIEHVVESCMVFGSVPVLVTSSVSGYALPLLQRFLQSLRKPHHWQSYRSLPTEFACNEVHWVGTLTVMTGIVVHGDLYVGQTLQLGPDTEGAFTVIQVESLHVHRIDVDVAYAGQSASVLVNGVGRDQIRRGTVLLDTSSATFSVREFDADLVSGTGGVFPGFQCVVHVGGPNMFDTDLDSCSGAGLNRDSGSLCEDGPVRNRGGPLFITL